jgi:ADP-L-glycero-D-manno-heptose 6-epimerase
MIVITGAAGFIGSVLAWKLNALGRTDLLLVDQRARNSSKWENMKKRRYEIYLESDEFLRQLEKAGFHGKISAMFHLGACSDTTEMDRDFLQKNNTEYTERLADWAIKNNVYFAYASSAATYGDGELGFSDADNLTPKLKSLNPYGQSKLDFDNWVLRHGFQNKITGFRYFNVYGPNEYHKNSMRSLADKGFHEAQSTGKLRLFKSYKNEYPDGGQKRDFIYVKDVVNAMIWFYQNPKVKGILNLGTGKAQSWNELAAALFKALGKPANIEYVDMPENLKNQYQYFTEADLTKLRNAGCPTTFRNLEEGVGDYVQRHLTLKDPYL